MNAPSDDRRGRPRATAASAWLILGIATAILGSSCKSAGEAGEEPVVFYPPAPDPPRIQFLRTVTLGPDIEKKRSSLDTLLFGDQDEQAMKAILAPYGSEVRDGVVYVCDLQQAVVLTLDFSGKSLGYVPLQGRGALQKPCNLDFADDGRLYIADLGRRQIVVLDQELAYEAEFGPFGEDSRPVDVDVDGDLLYVVDGGLKLVHVLDRNTGEQLRTIQGAEEGVSALRGPTNLAVGTNGKLYITDTIDCSIAVWEKSGEYVGRLGSVGLSVGQFARPKGIYYFEDLLFVVDAAFENCQIFDLEGEPLMFFGGPGVGPGNLYLPAGIWVGTEGLDLFKKDLEPGFVPESLIIVTNLYGPRKVNFYAFGKSTKFTYETNKEARAYVPEDDAGEVP